MKIIYDISSVSITRPVVTLGIFDGVHRAHRAIIDELTQEASQISGESLIVTLWPHPRIVLHREGDSLKLLNTLEEKIERLENTGIDNLVVLPFDKGFASTGFDDFIRDVLVKKLRVGTLIIGYNHQFGKNRKGNFSELQKLSAEYNFKLKQLAPYYVKEEKVSSTRIRKQLRDGQVKEAHHLLGYAYFLSGTVKEGRKLGREIGFPTANMQVNNPDKLIPKNGVYAVTIEIKNRKYRGMMNIGCRPTIDNICNDPVLEVNIFNFSDDLYGKTIKVEFMQYIRHEKKFSGIEQLKKQLTNDRETVNNYFNHAKKSGY